MKDIWKMLLIYCNIKGSVFYNTFYYILLTDKSSLKPCLFSWILSGYWIYHCTMINSTIGVDNELIVNLGIKNPIQFTFLKII